MKSKRILSVLLAIVMLSTMLPTVAFAESSSGTATGGLIEDISDFDTVLGAGNYEYSDRTIKILKDLTFNNPLMFELSNTYFTLDLNGKTLDMRGESVILYSGGLTIIDSGDGGTIKSSGDPVQAISYESDLNISGGTFTATGYGVAVKLDHCNSVISGGTFTGRYAIQRLNGTYDSISFKLAGSPVLNGFAADIYIENPSNLSSISYHGYEPADGDGPASIMMGNWPDTQYGRVVTNWDNDKTLSDYFVYAGTGSQNDPFIVEDPLYEHYVVAEKPYDAWIGTKRITRLNQDDVFGDGTVSFTPTSTNIWVLNLNDFSYEGSAHSATRGIIDIENYPYENHHDFYHVSANITGTNTIVAKNTPAYGIVTDSNFSLNGDGSLEISGCKYGMYITDANNWQLTKAANSIIPTLEITSTVATSNKSMYLYPNDKEYKLTLGTQAPVRHAGGKNIAIENETYFKVEEAPVKPVISIVTQPAASTKVTEGKISGTLTVTGSVANGSSASLNYQWYSNTVNANFSGTLIDGATSSSFTIPENLAPGTYYYYCTLSMDDANTVRSSVATVVVEAEVIVPTHTHGCGHDECDGAWENFVVIDGNIGATTNPRLTNGNTYYFVLGDNMSSNGFNPSIGSGTATVYLCLNGHSINDITIPAGVTMYICDCADEPGIVSARFNVYGTAMLGSGRYPLLRHMGNAADVHVYGPITMGDQADFSTAGNKTITLDNEDAKINFSAKPYMVIKFIPYGPGVFATGWESSFNYMPISADDAYEVVYNSTTGELSFVEKAATPVSYNITKAATENGSFNVPATAIEDEEVTIVATPDTGYELEKIIVTGESGNVTVTDGKFTMPGEDVTVNVTFKKTFPHTHCICGATHKAVGDHTEEDEKTFAAVSTYADLVTAATNGGNYYLANDIEITSAVTVEADDTFTLCLNGKKLYYGGTESVSIFALYGTLNITDCGTNVREGHVDDSSLMWKEGEGDESEDIPYNLTGGLITGSKGSANPITVDGQNLIAYGGALYMVKDSEFNFFGGNFAGNYSQQEGAVIIGEHCDINIYGGTMVGNYRGAIYCYDNSETRKDLAMHGGIIEYNHCGTSYSEVEFEGNFTMTGGEINARYNNGTAVNISSGDLTISGGTITNNYNYGYALQFFSDYEVTETEEDDKYICDYVFGNSANISGGTFKGVSAAICLYDGNLYLSGNPDISGESVDILNYPKAPYEEVYDGVTYIYNIVTGRIIACENFDPSKPISVKTCGEDEYERVTTDFTLNWTENMGDADPGRYFISDRSRCGAAKNVETGELMMVSREITQQPALENDYTVKVNVPGANYQWCSVEEESVLVTDENADPYDDNYDSETNKWTAVEEFGYFYYFTIRLNKGQIVTVELSSDDEYEPALYGRDYIYGTKKENAYVLTAPADGWYLLEIVSHDDVVGGGDAMPSSVSEESSSDSEYPTVIAKINELTYTEVAGQTAESLDTEELGGGKYACRVTWNMGTLSDESDDYVLVSDTVDIPYTVSVGIGEGYVSGVEAEGLDNVAVTYETDVTLNVKVEAVAEGDMEQNAIKNLPDAPSNFAFYDITLKDSSDRNISDTNEDVIEIKLPYVFSRKTNIKVYRYHNGIPEELAQLDVRTTAPYVDGKCFVDEENGCIYIYSSKFSTYAVAYDTVRSSSGGGVMRYTVKFETNGGSEIANKTVTRNSKVTEPAQPTKEGYTFLGWFIDEEFTTAYDFGRKVTKNITLYAKWEKVEEQEPEDTDTHNCPSKAFDDLDIDAWYHEAVDYALENGIFKGIGETTFAPNDKLTRAMLVTVLYRMENEPATNRSIPFSDVDMGAYYANAVSWAKQNGIVNGVTENKFAPDESITREQIAAIMFRYAQYKGMEAVTLEENLHFNDADEISEYAVSAMNWVVGTGLMNGKAESILAPKDNATRIEVAAILHRFMEANK